MGNLIDSEYKVRISLLGSEAEYIGEAQTGQDTGSPVWRIKKLTYVGSEVTQVDWASGEKVFKFVWDSRTDYTYS